MATKCVLPKDQIDVSLSSGSLKLTISLSVSAASTQVKVLTLLRDVGTWRDLVETIVEQPGFEDVKVDLKADLSFIPPAIGEWQPAQSGGASSAGVAGAADRVAAQEAVFEAILGDPSKPLTKSSDEELAALARATGLDPAAMAKTCAGLFIRPKGSIRGYIYGQCILLKLPEILTDIPKSGWTNCRLVRCLEK